jgi:hypothetical protein
MEDLHPWLHGYGAGRQNMLESFMSVRGVSVSVFEGLVGGFCLEFWRFLELSPLEFWGWVLWRLGVFGAGYPAPPELQSACHIFPTIASRPFKGYVVYPL